MFGRYRYSGEKPPPPGILFTAVTEWSYIAAGGISVALRIVGWCLMVLAVSVVSRYGAFWDTTIIAALGVVCLVTGHAIYRWLYGEWKSRVLRFSLDRLAPPPPPPPLRPPSRLLSSPTSPAPQVRRRCSRSDPHQPSRCKYGQHR